MSATSSIAEYQITAALSVIENGDGTPGDGDGLYNVDNPEQQYGSNVDVFPREADFLVGSATFDATGLTGCDTETVAIDAIDLGELWTADAETSDLSDAGLKLWFFEAPLSVAIGDLDAADTVTFENGVLNSIDVEVPFTFTVDYTFGAGEATSYAGTLTLAGNALSISIDDTQTDVPTASGTQPESRVVFDLTGTLLELSALAPEGR